MEKVLFLVLWICMFREYSCQGDNSPVKLPKERGLILTLLDRNTPTHAVIRHIPIFLGYESFNGSIPGIRITSRGNTHALSIDVDFRSKEFFMYDYHLGSIIMGTGYHKELNATNIDLYTLHMGVSKGTVQIAYDWLSKTVYWTDSLYRWIIAAPTDMGKITNDYYKIIVDDHLDFPDGIAVDPINGYLFWSDNGVHPKIERSDLDGKNRHTIITKHLKSPSSIKADIFDKRIYWIDSLSEDILSATYEGRDIKMIARISRSVLFDIAIYKDVVYVSDIYNDDLYTLNKTTGRQQSTIVQIPDETVYGLAVYGEETQPLKDKDYCAMKNCDQLCITEQSGAKCICSEGYILNTTTGLCQESNAQFHKAVVFSNSTHICLRDLRGLAHDAYGLLCRFNVLTPPSSASTTSPVPSSTSSPSVPTASPNDLIKMIELDVDNRVIYFASGDNKIYRRPVDLPIENGAKELIKDAPGIISGLAYDLKYSPNLYWSESDTNNIWYVDTSTLFSNRIFIGGQTTLVNPRDIIVLPNERSLAWVAGNQGNVSIQMMTITGQNLRTVKANLPEIVSMVYDHEARVFYFVSNDKLYKVALNGTEISQNPLENPNVYLILHYNNYLSWIYTSAALGNVIKTKNVLRDTTITHNILSGTSLYNGMKILDTNLKLSNSSPCAFMNGGCEQVCIPMYSSDIMTKVCDCSLGFKLEKDGLTCRSDLTMDNFLLVTDWTNTALHQIDLSTGGINSIYNKENTIYVGMYYDATSGRLIWTEYRRRFVYSSKLDGSYLRTIGDIGDAYPYRMDKDTTTGNLYYTTIGGNDHIGVLTPSGINKVLRRKKAGEILGDIVVHPKKGWMFYTIVATVSYIARANMDGTNERKIIIGNHVTVPDGLTIDFTNNTLYWSDAANDTVQRCNFDGRECVTLVNRTGTYKPEEIRDLVTDGEFLYYSSYLRDHVVRVDIKAPNVTKIVGQNPSLGKLDTMVLYRKSSKNIQPINEACKAHNGLGDCSTICLPTETGRTCSCEDGVQLKMDGKTCSTIYQCSDVISQKIPTKRGKETIDVVINRTCNRYLNDTCSYSCPAFYIPTRTSKLILKCTNVGWDRETEPLCKELVCPVPVSNIKIVGKCSMRPGDACSFECDSGHKKTSDKILCDNTLNWSPKQKCMESATVSVSQAQSGGVPVGGVAAIVVVLVVIIIALVVIVVFFLLRRRRTQRQSTSSAAQFHNGQDGSIAIENPGYIPTEPSTTTNLDEHPYSTVDPSHVQLGEGAADKLPEVSHVTHDTAVLTLDSWMKEQRQKDN